MDHSLEARLAAVEARLSILSDPVAALPLREIARLSGHSYGALRALLRSPRRLADGGWHFVLYRDGRRWFGTRRGLAKREEFLRGKRTPARVRGSVSDVARSCVDKALGGGDAVEVMSMRGGRSRRENGLPNPGELPAGRFSRGER